MKQAVQHYPQFSTISFLLGFVHKSLSNHICDYLTLSSFGYTWSRLENPILSLRDSEFELRDIGPGFKNQALLMAGP